MVSCTANKQLSCFGVPPSLIISPPSLPPSRAISLSELSIDPCLDSPTVIIESSPTPAIPSSPAVVEQPPTVVVEPPPLMVIEPPPLAVVEPPSLAVIKPFPLTVVGPSLTVVEPSPTPAVQPPPVVVEPLPMAVVQASLNVADQPSSIVVQTAAPIVVDMQRRFETGLDTELVPASPHTNPIMATSEVNLPSTCPGPSSNVTIPAASLILASGNCYPKFITPGILAYLSDVTGVEGWSDLV